MLTRMDSNNVFDLDIYIRRYNQDVTIIKNTLIKVLMKELEILGWTCKSMYGDTSILIYNEDNPPVQVNCTEF